MITIKSYIEEHFREPINLKSTASHFYLNSAYLGQLFKRRYGIYFNEYLTKLRMDEAKKLLRESNLRIYEIAKQVGFNQAAYFVTQFEKREQMSPSVYRNQVNDQE
ncbi:helix-turn-helix domain-containing protein [Paenibacillus sp. LHD-117]|nr:helix-turn-helix domain-containing protein [Paenibacillus sp. LHD-117]MDQ6417853.1 helix-turn-helix domain-containing protein [Paenibacillus sp. LHD-117]